jgi:hypothetical protein
MLVLRPSRVRLRSRFDRSLNPVTFARRLTRTEKREIADELPSEPLS